MFSFLFSCLSCPPYSLSSCWGLSNSVSLWRSAPGLFSHIYQMEIWLLGNELLILVMFKAYVVQVFMTKCTLFCVGLQQRRASVFTKGECTESSCSDNMLLLSVDSCLLHTRSDNIIYHDKYSIFHLFYFISIDTELTGLVWNGYISTFFIWTAKFNITRLKYGKRN